MNGPEKSPLLVLNRVDKGRVALLLSDQMWLWARGFDGGGPYLDLLRRLAHWLIEGDGPRGRSAAGAGQRPRPDDRAPEPEGRGSQATVTGPDGKATTVQLGAGRARPVARNARPSIRTGSIAPATASMLRWPWSGRRTRSSFRTSYRHRRAETARRATGGGVHRLARGADDPACRPSGCRDAAVAELFGVRLHRDQARRGQRADRREATPLAIGFLGLALLLGALVWTWRREGGRATR